MTKNCGHESRYYTELGLRCKWCRTYIRLKCNELYPQEYTWKGEIRTKYLPHPTTCACRGTGYTSPT